MTEQIEENAVIDEPAEDQAEAVGDELPSAVTGAVSLATIAAPDPDTPIFNETIDALADRLPSLAADDEPANDSTEGEQD